MKNLAAPLVIGITILIAVGLLTSTYKNRARSNDTIHVTGLGSVDFESDLIVWSGSFSKKSLDLKSAYSLIKTDQNKVQQYLTSKGVQDSQILFSSVDINKEFDYRYDQNGKSYSVFSGYRLSQSVEIESEEVAKIEKISREVTEIINNGVEFNSQSPRYYYQRLAELKLEMIASATEDGTKRAQEIARNANASLGDLYYARMGVFQIIAQNSSEDYSWGGTFNTDSKMKTATITMKLQFGVD